MCQHEVTIKVGDKRLPGVLALPNSPCGVVVFAHGSGSGRNSPRNKFVADVLNQAHLATLLLDLLTSEEEIRDARSGELRFDIELLAMRFVKALEWTKIQQRLQGLPLGCFGASTGAAAAIIAAGQLPTSVRALVSRGGRPDLATLPQLHKVQAPCLLIVGGNDQTVLALNQRAQMELPDSAQLAVVPGASHLFEEPGALETVAQLAAQWFSKYLLSS